MLGSLDNSTHTNQQEIKEMANRHLDIMKKIDTAMEALWLQRDDHELQFDLFFDIEEMDKIAEFLDNFDTEIQNEVDANEFD